MTISETVTGNDVSPLPVYGMVASLIGSGVGHFAAPARFDAVMPEELPGSARIYTYLSGIVEVGVGVLLLLRRTRRAGGWAAFAFFVIVTPAVVNGIRLARGKGGFALLIAIARLPLQISMIKRAFKITRNA